MTQQSTRPKKRKALSPKTRFDVFKRDDFTCQYCGAHPPGVLLQVDHIIAVANGGTNDVENLVTACQPCNSGKGARELSSVPQSLKDKAEDVREREAQLRGYQAVMEARLQRIAEEVERVCDVYEQYNPGYTLIDQARRSVRIFVERLGVHEVIEAMEIACTADIPPAREFRYFCGVCWRKIKEDQ